MVLILLAVALSTGCSGPAASAPTARLPGVGLPTPDALYVYTNDWVARVSPSSRWFGVFLRIADKTAKTDALQGGLAWDTTARNASRMTWQGFEGVGRLSEGQVVRHRADVDAASRADPLKGVQIILWYDKPAPLFIRDDPFPGLAREFGYSMAEVGYGAVDATPGGATWWVRRITTYAAPQYDLWAENRAPLKTEPKDRPYFQGSRTLRIRTGEYDPRRALERVLSRFEAEVVHRS